jgi:hypothetical protein
MLIKSELNSMELHQSKFQDMTIFIDEVRFFKPTVDAYKAHPYLKDFVNWSNKYNFDWLLKMSFL